VAGTASDAGKSVLTAGICRWLARQGVTVAPFKAQNMSNNSVIAPDGAEIGRAQAMQAAAAGIPAEAAMNPVLLKPGGELRSHLVVLGRPAGEVGVTGYWGTGRGGKGCAARCSAPTTTCGPGSTSWCARGPARPPRSTCGHTTSSTWG
jgi:cobyric acid synthase